jgi:hypothetical protein
MLHFPTTSQKQLHPLKAATDTGDSQAFLRQLALLDQDTLSAPEAIQVIKMALLLDMPAVAIDLARHAGTRFPNDPDIQQAVALLAPTNAARPTTAPPVKGLRQSQEWLRQNAADYRGQWVAVHQGRLLGAARTLPALRELLTQAHHQDTSSTIITRVL